MVLPARRHFIAIVEFANITALNRLLNGEIAIPNNSPITGQPITHHWRGKRLYEQLPTFTRTCRRPGGGPVVGCAMEAALTQQQLRILRLLLLNVVGFERDVNIWWTEITAKDVARWGSRAAARRNEGLALLLAANMELVPEED